MSGRHSLNKGKAFERQIAKEMRQLGFKDCMTTREARGGDWSKTDYGVDIVHTGAYAIQCKRLAKYVSVNTIEEIRPNNSVPINMFELMELKVPILLTRANKKPTMAIIPWEDLKKLLKH